MYKKVFEGKSRLLEQPQFTNTCVAYTHGQSLDGCGGFISEITPLNASASMKESESHTSLTNGSLVEEHRRQQSSEARSAVSTPRRSESINWKLDEMCCVANIDDMTNESSVTGNEADSVRRAAQGITPSNMSTANMTGQRSSSARVSVPQRAHSSHSKNELTPSSTLFSYVEVTSINLDVAKSQRQAASSAQHSTTTSTTRSLAGECRQTGTNTPATRAYPVTADIKPDFLNVKVASYDDKGLTTSSLSRMEELYKAPHTPFFPSSSHSSKLQTPKRTSANGPRGSNQYSKTSTITSTPVPDLPAPLPQTRISELSFDEQENVLKQHLAPRYPHSPTGDWDDDDEDFLLGFEKGLDAVEIKRRSRGCAGSNPALVTPKKLITSADSSQDSAVWRRKKTNASKEGSRQEEREIVFKTDAYDTMLDVHKNSKRKWQRKGKGASHKK